MPRNDVYHPMAPVDLPAETGRVNEVSVPETRTQVAVELGIPILFDVRTRQFHAKVNPVAGRGGSAEIHSADFEEILTKIRERALVVPVRGYTVSAYDSVWAKRPDPVDLEPVEVIEYHRTRQAPWVVRYRAKRKGVETMETRACGQVYLPTTEQVDEVRAASFALIETKARHKEELAAAEAAVRDAMGKLTALDAATLRYIQKSGEQAVHPDELGLPSFDMEEDDDADDD